MYLKRTLEETVQRASEAFSVLLVTGPRQVGKTTLLEHCADRTRRFVTLDNIDERRLAQTDPDLFFKKYAPPILIDEVQYAPQIFSAIKVICDRERRSGLFWLTGSQKFHLMRNVSESLAGRVAVLDMLGLSAAEIFGRPYFQAPFLPTTEWINTARKYASSPFSLMDVYGQIWMGSFPQVVLDKKTERDLFYKSYVQTYIERDVRAMTNLAHEEGFYGFLSATAARTGQLLNYADLARDAGIDHRCVKSWLNILETSGLVYFLRPYHVNITKRLLKTPKLYFLDTGLCSFLTRWDSPESLERGAMSGAILETYMFAEILKSYWHRGKGAYFNFYRDKDQKEIDLIIEQNNTLYPIEFKKTATPYHNAPKNFKILEKLKKNIGHGAIICLKDTDLPLSSDVDALPVSYL